MKLDIDEATDACGLRLHAFPISKPRMVLPETVLFDSSLTTKDIAA